MWVEFVVGSRPCSEGFFSGYSSFAPSAKTNISKLNFDLETVDEEPLCGCATEIPIYLLFIYIIIYLTVEFMTSGDPDYNNNNFIITEREINTQHCWN